MTGRWLPATAMAAAGVALTGLVVRAIAPHHSAGIARPATGPAASYAAVDASPALLIRFAIQRAQELLACPANSSPAGGRSRSSTAGRATSISPSAPAATAPPRLTLTSPAPGTCGQLIVLRTETRPNAVDVALVLLIGVLQPDPGRGREAVPPPIPMALRVQVWRNPAGALIAQVVGP